MKRRPFKDLSLSYYVFAAIMILIPHNLSAQALGFPSGKSLSLTIWGAGVSSTSSEGKRWDAQSLPDSLVRVYLAGRLVGESGVQRDKQQPMWALTVGPFLEYQFIEGGITVKVFEQDLIGEELIEELSITLPTLDKVNRVARLDGIEVKPLIYQWVDSSTQLRSDEPTAVRERSFTLGEEEESASSKDAQRAELKSRARVTPFREPRSELIDPDQLKRERARSAKRASAAATLYRAYLKAQFSGDQLEEHRILLKLIQRYGQTRHGRKAKRLLLLDGR